MEEQPKVLVQRGPNGEALCKCGGSFVEFYMLHGQPYEVQIDRDITEADVDSESAEFDPTLFPGRVVTDPHVSEGELESEGLICNVCGEEPPTGVLDLFTFFQPTATKPCPVPEDFEPDVAKARKIPALRAIVELVEAQAKFYAISPESLCWFLREQIRAK